MCKNQRVLVMVALAWLFYPALPDCDVFVSIAVVTDSQKSPPHTEHILHLTEHAHLWPPPCNIYLIRHPVAGSTPNETPATHIPHPQLPPPRVLLHLTVPPPRSTASGCLGRAVPGSPGPPAAAARAGPPSQRVFLGRRLYAGPQSAVHMAVWSETGGRGDPAWGTVVT